MPSVFEKLNLKDQTDIVVLNAPESFEPELARLGKTRVHRTLNGLQKATFLLAFVTWKAQVDALAGSVDAVAQGDAIVWFAYPKGTSKRYPCDFNRDNGWDTLNALGWESVRMIAIDEDWSALRLRRSAYVKARKN
jgi:hypothetical protein